MPLSTLNPPRTVGSVQTVVLASLVVAFLTTSALAGSAQAVTAGTAQAGSAAVARGVLAPVSGSNPERLVQSTGNLYWTTNNYNEFGPGSSRLFRASKQGRPGQERVLYRLEHQNNVHFGALAYAKVGLTWYGYVVSNNTSARTSRILRIPLEGGAATPLFTSPRYISTRDLVSDGSSLYWADENGLRAGSVNGGAVRTLVSGTPTISKLDVAVGQLYFAFGNSVRRIPAAGGAISTVVATSSPVTALDVKASPPARLYWGQADNAVKSRALTGGAVTTHQGAVASRRITSVAFDGSRVLWTSCSPVNNACSTVKRSGASNVTVVSGRVGSTDVQGDAAAMFWGDHAVQRYTH